MSKCKFTIITVCYNAENYIEDTIKSVLSQTYDNFEYIIKDGQSVDRTMEIVHSLTDNDNYVMIIQGKDRGIYDAMNVAVMQASGEYILFLNAGDILAGPDVLYKVSEYIAGNKAEILYGDVIEIEENNRNLRVYTEKNCKMWYYSLGACLCHQGMFCKRELFENKLFDIKYKVCADREWQMYHIRNGAIARAMKFTIAEVLVNGFSKNHIADLEKETRLCVMSYCGKWHIIYEIISICKKSEFVHKIIQRVEKMISSK